MCHIKWNKMKIYFLFFLLSISFDAFSSSPVTKLTSESNNDKVQKVQSSTKEILPLVKNNFSKMNSPLEKADVKAAVTTKSIEKNEPVAETHQSSNAKNSIVSLSNATENRPVKGLNKINNDGNTNNAYNDVILKMKSSMHDYFSKMHNVLKKLESEKYQKSGSVFPINENKDHITNANTSSIVQNNHKHLDKAASDLQKNVLDEVKNSGNALEEYNNAIQEMESFMKEMLPKIDNYFLKMRHILKIQEEHSTDKPIRSSPDFIKKKDKANMSPNVLESKKSLENASTGHDKTGLSKIKAEEKMPQADKSSKMHNILKRYARKEGDKSISTIKSIVKKNNFEATASVSVKNVNNLKKTTDDPRQKLSNNKNTIEKLAKNHLDRDSKLLVKFSANTEDVKRNSIEKNSEGNSAFVDTSNKQSSNRKKVNFNQKEILNDGNKDNSLKMNDVFVLASKMSHQPNDVNKKVLHEFGMHSTSQNKVFAGITNSENIVTQQHPEELNTKRVSTDAKSIKKNQEINVNNVNVVSVSTKSKSELTNEGETGRMANKIPYSAEKTAKNYRKNAFSKTDATSQNSPLVNEVNAKNSETFQYWKSHDQPESLL